MNKLMYSALACAFIFLAVCIGVKLKNNTPPLTPAKPAKSTEEQAEEQKRAHSEITAIVQKMEVENIEVQQPEKAPSVKGPVLAVSELYNLVKNPTANSGTENWLTIGEVTIESSNKKNPCFVLRNRGKLKQKIKLHNAAMQFVVVVACGSAPRNNKDKSDPAGLPLIRIYFEDNKKKEHAEDAVALVMTTIGQNDWGQIGVVKQIPANSIYLHLELHQAPGKSPVANITRFDDVSVFIARNKEAGNKMLASYVKQAQAFSR